MEQNYQIYEKTIDKIIENNKNSVKDIIATIKNMNIFDDTFLLHLISHLKMYKLYEITCKELPEFKYYMLSIGESNFIFNGNNNCFSKDCNIDMENKIRDKNTCIHKIGFKILLGINAYIKIQIDKSLMIDLIKENFDL